MWADPGCPWATLALYRLHRARRDAGAEDRLVFDIRAFPLELLNGQPTPRLIVDAEIPVVGGLEPDIGMSLWSGRVDAYPVTTLLAFEAIMAAKEQGAGPADRLDLALRLALFRDSLCISLHHVICEVAGRVEGLDAAALEDALRSGRHRPRVFTDKEEAESTGVQGSPHLFLPDGSDMHNPGITMHKTDDFGEGGYPIVEKDEPGVYEDIVKRSVA